MKGWSAKTYEIVKQKFETLPKQLKRRRDSEFVNQLPIALILLQTKFAVLFLVMPRPPRIGYEDA